MENGPRRSIRSIQHWPMLKDGRVWPMEPWAATARRRRKPRCSTRYVTYRSRSTALSSAALALGPHLGSEAHHMRMESRFDGNLIDRLMAAVHDVK